MTLFSSMDVHAEISNQTNARKYRHSTGCSPSVGLRVPSRKLETGSGDSQLPKVDGVSGAEVVTVRSLCDSRVL